MTLFSHWIARAPAGEPARGGKKEECGARLRDTGEGHIVPGAAPVADRKLGRADADLRAFAESVEKAGDRVGRRVVSNNEDEAGGERGDPEVECVKRRARGEGQAVCDDRIGLARVAIYFEMENGGRFERK